MFKYLRGDYSQKESRQRIVISSACCSLYFRNKNRIVRSRFRWFNLATVLIPVSARTLPSSAEPPNEIRLWMLAVRVYPKPVHPLFKTVRAEPFTLMWERVWVLFRTTQRFQSTHICLFRLIRCVRADQCCRNADFQACSRFSLLSKPNTISQSVRQVRHFSK